MGVGELVGKVLAEEHADLLRQAVRWLAEQLMQAEPTAAAGPSYGQCHPDRAARRNGYRQRARDTRVGSVELASPGCVRRLRPQLPAATPPQRAGAGRGSPLKR